MSAVAPRLNRLFGFDGRCVCVAADDDDLFDADNAEALVDVLVEAAPDAIRLSAGAARLLQSQPGPKPALVLRADAEADVEQAVRLDAACVVAGHTDVRALRAACHRVAMPLLLEMADERLIREAVELGADVVVTAGDYAAAPVPVLARIARRSDEELLRRTEGVLAAGAAGVVCGRDVVQHEDLVAIIRALNAVVHDGVTADEALELVRV